METRLLIDAIMQQTTLLIGQLVSSAGIRAPLSHFADQVFLDLANELERQGATRNVVADMFGMALRSYQKKVNRLRASVTDTEQTLWQGVLEYVRKNGGATRKQVLAAFRSDEERHVVGVLGDLVSSGLLYATGRGKHAAYELTPAHQREAMVAEQRLESLIHLVWLEISDRPGIDRAQLLERFGKRSELLDQALASLLADGRIELQGDGRFECRRLLIPVGSEAGWETAVFDHFRAVCAAIAAKLREGPPADPNGHQRIGGTTLSFDIHPDHPHEEEVKGLLERFRKEAFEVWNRVSERNQLHPVAEAKRTKVVFYFGQNVIGPTESDD